MTVRENTVHLTNRRCLNIWQYLAIDARAPPCCQTEPFWGRNCGKTTREIREPFFIKTISANKCISEPSVALLDKELLFLMRGWGAGSDAVLLRYLGQCVLINFQVRVRYVLSSLSSLYFCPSAILSKQIEGAVSRSQRLNGPTESSWRFGCWTGRRGLPSALFSSHLISEPVARPDECAH